MERVSSPPCCSVQRGGGKTAFLRHGCPSLYLPAWKEARSSSCLPAHIWREPSPPGGSLRTPHRALLLFPGIAPPPRTHARSGSHSSSVIAAALSLSHYFQPVGLSDDFILARNWAGEPQSRSREEGMLRSREGCSCPRTSTDSAPHGKHPESRRPVVLSPA